MWQVPTGVTWWSSGFPLQRSPTAVLRLEERLRMLERSERRGRRHSSWRPLEDAAQTGQALETMRMLQSRIDGTGDGLALT